MAAYTLAPYEERQYFDDDGEPLALGKVYTYASGTTTPIFTYADDSGTLNANPVILSASGRARIYLDVSLAYKFILTDANDVPVGLTMDPVATPQTVVAGTSPIFQASTRGTAGAPAFSFTADSDTGVYSSGANTLNLATGGTERVRIFASGGVSIGDTTDPGALGFRVAGNEVVVGLLNVTGAVGFASTMNAAGAVVLNSTLAVTGATTLSSTLAVTGAVTLSGAATAASLHVTANSQLDGLLNVTGAVGFASTLNAGGATVLSTTLAVTGATTLTGAVSIGSTLAVTGATTLTGAVSIGSANVTDGVGTPTIASGFGGSAAISGKSYAFKVSNITGVGFTGTVNFGTTYATAPIVVATDDSGGTMRINSVSTTQCVFSNAGTVTAFYAIVRGY